MKDLSPQHTSGQSHYGRLAWMIVLSFISMYVLMYSMVDRFENVYMNINQVYMAGVMAAPMGLIELALMAGMYPNRKLNIVVVVGSVLALLLAWVLIRQQAAVSDRQFLRSMIPHHAGAILMCNEAPIQDAEIRTLCQSIVEGQQREIDQMKALLDRLSR
jgi:uncharacterized protein (DUF305 family)